MPSKPPLNPARVRRITGSFSWLDHRLIQHGFLARLSPAALLLYFFFGTGRRQKWGQFLSL